MFRDLRRVFMFSMKRMFDYRGRSCREEFWYFVIAALLFHVPVWLLASIVSKAVSAYAGFLVVDIYRLIAALALLALQARRLHDLGYSALWLGLYTVPLLLAIIPPAAEFISFNFIYAALVGCVMMVCFTLKGMAGPNRFGDDPLQK